MSAAEFIEPAVRAVRQIGLARLAKAGVALGVILAIGYLAKSIDFEGLAQWVDFNDRTGAIQKFRDARDRHRDVVLDAATGRLLRFRKAFAQTPQIARVLD